MHIITQTKLRIFGRQHPDADASLRVWETIMRAKKYKNTSEVKADFVAVDFLRGNKAIFNIGGNKYRLVVKMMFRWGRVLIRGVYTHEEYTRLIKKGLL